MKIFLTMISIFSIAILASCDLRSGIAKKEMEKFETKPTPQVAPAAAEVPILPEEIVEVDTGNEGDPITLNVYDEVKTSSCTKFDRLRINGSGNEITIKGPCRQIMINGDRNKVTADASLEFIFNGSNNIIKYSRFPNGKRPVVTDNGPDNSIEKMSVPAVTGNLTNRKIVK
jgi:hypothetical protein